MPKPVRDSGGSFQLDNPEDGTPIKEMISLKGGLLLITEKCTYRVQLADQIDPKRTNPNLPHNTHQKLFDQGTNSEPLCKTLMVAKVLFRKEFQPQLDLEKAMELTLAALSEIDSVERAAREFAEAEKEAIEKAKQFKPQTRSVGLPSVGNIDVHCKTFTQRAHHFGGALLKIVRLFYPGAKNWDKLQEIVRARYGTDDPFYKVVAATKPTLLLVLHARDSLEHHNEGVTTLDFEMQPDGTINAPTIELHFRTSSLPRCSISLFMQDIIKSLLVSFEMIVTHACSKSAQPFAGMPVMVGPLSDDMMKAWHVRYAYGIYDSNGRFAPIG